MSFHAGMKCFETRSCESGVDIEVNVAVYDDQITNPCHSKIILRCVRVGYGGRSGVHRRHADDVKYASK